MKIDEASRKKWSCQMKFSEAIYCLNAESECCEEICDECPLYGQVGIDHCYEEALHMAVEALKFQQEYGSDLMLLDEFIKSRGKELIQLRKEMDKEYQDKVQKCIERLEEHRHGYLNLFVEGVDLAIRIVKKEFEV